MSCCQFAAQIDEYPQEYLLVLAILGMLPLTEVSGNLHLGSQVGP
jgi:hypothetical protein